MKRLLTGFCGLVLVLALPEMGLAQRNPRGTASLTLNGKTVSVEYGRPALQGRTVGQLLGQLETGEIWRLGADKSTTLSTNLGLAFGSATVPKGEYSLWVRREAGDQWKLLVNKVHGQWGTEHDPAEDLTAVALKQTKATKSEEQVTLGLTQEGNGGVLTIQWGDMLLSTSFKAK